MGLSRLLHADGPAFGAGPVAGFLPGAIAGLCLEVPFLIVAIGRRLDARRCG